MGTWEEFVRTAQQPEPVDNFVRLLRHRLASGCQVVRIRLVAGAAPAYEVLLNCQKELTPYVLPHSEGFTAWSLEAGVAMETGDDEASRFRLILEDRLRVLRHEVGPEAFDGAFVQQLRSLAPPHAIARLGPGSSDEGIHDRWLSGAIRGVLDRSIQDLVSALHYSPAAAAVILDVALEQLLTGWMEIRDRRTPSLP